MEEEITSISSIDEDVENNEAITIDEKIAKLEKKRAKAEKDPLESESDDFSEDHWAGDRNRGWKPDSEKKNYRKGKGGKKKKRLEDMNELERAAHEAEQEGESEEEFSEDPDAALIKDEDLEEDPFAKLDEVMDQGKVQEQK